MSGDTTADALLAQGWKARELPGYIGAAGPLWTLKEGDAWVYGLLATPAHLNPAGLVHGGALATLMDHALSTVAWEASDRRPCVTVSLDLQYLGAARAGQLVQARAEVVRATAGLVFMTGTLRAQGEPVVTAQAVMKVLRTATNGASAA